MRCSVSNASVKENKSARESGTEITRRLTMHVFMKQAMYSQVRKEG